MRRRIVSVIGALVLVTAGVWGASPAAAHTSGTADDRTTTPIKHFLVLMQSGHSFDNYFGTYPGADGIDPATCMPVSTPATSGTACVRPFPIAGHALTDLGPSRAVHSAEYDGGKMDGFVSAFARLGGAGNQAMGYYGAQDIPYYWNVADDYVLFDRFFTAAAGGSVWNHMFWVTGTPGNPSDDALDPAGFDAVPTIFDELQKAGVSWKFYAQNYHPEVTFRTPGDSFARSQLVRVPLLNYNRFLDDPALNSHIVDITQYYEDAKNGTLPAVSFMVPSGTGEHPPSSIPAGERFVSSLVDALMLSPDWNTSAFMWTYDDWGGWYDHVAPPAVDSYGYGFRSPALLVSPYAKRGHVDHTTLDVTSELKFIENNWGVAPLASRDAAANDITPAFDFSAPARPAVLLGSSRRASAPAPTRTGAVYPSYGAALLVVPLLVGIAVLRRRKEPPEVVR